MSPSLLRLIYVLMILIGIICMYTILNAKSPDSLLRPWVADPDHDVWVAAVTSIIVFVLGRIPLNTTEEARSMRKRCHSPDPYFFLIAIHPLKPILYRVERKIDPVFSSRR